MTTAAHASRPGFIRTRDGVDLFYRDWGHDRGRGGTFVFVSSWSLSSDSWAYQMLALCERGFRCIAFDRRGHGRSGDPGTGFDFDILADDLGAVLDALDLRDVTLVGHSMGPGEIVRYLTRHGSGRVARIVMIGTITPLLALTDDNPDGIDATVFETFRSQSLMRDFPKWLEDNVRPFMAPETSPDMTGPDMMGWVKAMAMQASLKALLDCHRAITSADFREELAKITVPTLVIHGDRDVTCPIGLARRTAELMPNATLSVYEGAPHGLFLTHMDRLERDLLAFAG